MKPSEGRRTEWALRARQRTEGGKPNPLPSALHPPSFLRSYGPALALGLYVARVLAEALRGEWGSAAPLILALLGIAGGGLLGRRAVQRGLDMTPAWVLLIYVLWPRLAPAVAVGSGFVAAVTALAGRFVPDGGVGRSPWTAKAWLPQSPILRPLDAALFLSALIVYVGTLAPDVLPADSGEFQLAAPLLGVPHPPGYPLYMLLGRLFTLLPIGNPAYQLNLLSAVSGALTLALVSATVRRICAGLMQAQGAFYGAIAAALALGAATTFWAQSTTANVRSLTGLFTALCLYALMARRWGLFALSLGLGLTHHASLAFFGLVFVLYLLLTERGLWRQPRRWARLIGLAALPALVFLYLPIRGAQGAPLAPPDLASWQGFWAHVLARGFAGDMFAFARPDLLAGRLPVLGTILLFEFNLPLLLAMALGAVLLLVRDWRLFLLLAGGTALHSFVAITYRAPQTVEYMFPAYVALAVLAGSAVSWLMGADVAFRAIGATVLLAGIALGGRNLPSYRWLAGDHDTRDYAQTLLQQAPAEAIILSNWHWATPMWYLQEIEGQRRDVEVRYIFPEGAEPIAQTWARRLDEAMATGRPVIVTQFYAAEFGARPYRFEPLGEAFLVRDRPRFDLPADLIPLHLDFEGKIRLLGYRLDSDQAEAGGQVVLTLAWQPLAELDRDYSAFVHLIGPEGPPLAQSDQRLPTSRSQPGEIILDRYVLTVPWALPASGPQHSLRLALGVYTARPEGGTARLTLADGRDMLMLSTVRVKPGRWPPLTHHPLTIPFVGGDTLVGVDYDSGRAGAPRTYLHWVDRTTGDRLTVVDESGALLREGVSTGRPWVGPWGVLHYEPVRLPLPLPGERYIPLGGDLILAGTSSQPRGSARPGSTLVIVPEFWARRPGLRDRVVSVNLIGPEGSWQAQDDSVPALGAIPTLKWVWGAAVHDPHAFHIPEDAAPGAATARLIVYDAFTQAPLPLLDPQLAQLSPTVALGTWEVRP